MSAEPTGRDGQSLLMRISNEIVQIQKKYLGKGPTKARSYFFDDMLLVVMRGGLTTAEKTMLEFDQADTVRQFRQTFQNEMTDRITGVVEEITGRTVINYQSQVMFDPDVVIEIFVFGDRSPEGTIDATAGGQLRDDAVGELITEEPPSDGGQR